MANRLLIVSNRLPITVKLEKGELSVERSSGGLATGLSGFHDDGDSLWLGWPGDVSRFSAAQRTRLEQDLEAMRVVPVHLSPAEIKRYYVGFSNGVLWPLYHHLTDIVERDAWRNWTAYRDVNARFADVVASRYRPGDRIWVHDYQLSLLPGMLRERIPTARIGFFLHIPFPSSEAFRILPWRREILEGMLGADLIGFHTHSYHYHFARTVLVVLGAAVEEERIRHGDRDIRLGAFPMGVDANSFARMAAEPGLIEQVKAIRNQAAGQRLLVGVDRLDYTKGLKRRMMAVDRFLEREDTWRGKIRMVQVVVPSRTEVEAYDRYHRELEELVGHINGKYGTVHSVPIHYLFRSQPPREIVALYRAADVMLVTPVRDGMNLVAKEFVASRVDEDGVLVLSEFAGAAAELAEAVQVNPYDLDQVATALQRALTMRRDERRERMRALRRRVEANDCFAWAARFLDALEAACQVRDTPIVLSPRSEVDRVRDEIQSCGHLLILLDYDGTLVPFAPVPHLAIPDPELKDLLRRLSRRPGTEVHVVSGRSKDTMQQWLGRLPIGLHAEHGFWSRPPGWRRWIPLRQDGVAWKQALQPLLEKYARATPGSLIEEKTASLAWHYRMADTDLGELQARRLAGELESRLAEHDLDLLRGSRVLEIRRQGIHKGIVAQHVLRELPADGCVLAMGDDRTDEDMFAALDGARQFAVKIGSGPSRATLRLADPGAARAFLKGLLPR